MAGTVDALFIFLTLLSVVMTVAIFATVLFFATKYRRRAGVEAEQIEGSTILELAWSIIPMGIFIVIFVWGAVIFFEERTPPMASTEVYVVAKQWMWKLEHAEGPREINALHVPVGRDIKLIMTSQDVIHDFFVPAFRTKADVLPGKYTTEWFKATKLGEYHIFCAEYCGTKHSGMIGTVYVMTQSDYNDWLGRGSGEGSMAEQGQALFNQLGCGNCHPGVVNNQNGRCPNLVGLYGTRVELKDGTNVRADETYIRESVLYPESKIVAGYDNIMPTFKGLITEDGMLKLVEYIKSLGAKNGTVSTATPLPTQTGDTPPTPAKGQMKTAPRPAPAAAGQGNQ